MNRDRWTRWIYPTVGILLLIFSIYILQKELGRYSLDDIIVSLSKISDRQLSLALAFAFTDYLAISSYDLIAFHQLNHYLDKKRILFTTFITYAVSNTTGFTLLIGGGIRYRFYSFWGVPPRIVAKIIALGNITFWLGLFSLGGITFLVNPLQLPSTLPIQTMAMQYLGIVALIVVGTYLYFCWQRKGIKIKGKIIRFPKPVTSLAQIAAFVIDWALAAAVLYCLIPSYADKSYLQFFSIYLIAMSTSIMSNIPGGIGVFETVIIFLLPQSIFKPDILSSLLVYRSMRFLIPLAIALILICCFELRRRYRKVRK
ncbi:MAG: lysylphosphatidylglycerol synthase domain-containing protein [Cyanobacteria bacterium J06623_7]